MEFQGSYFDGRDAKAHAVSIVFEPPDTLRIRGRDRAVDRTVDLSECRIPPAVGQTRRCIHLPDGSRCDTEDAAALGRIEAAVGRNRGQRAVRGMEARWGVVAMLLAGMAAASIVLVVRGIPWLAEVVARRVPATLVETTSRSVLDALEQQGLKPSALSPDRAERAQRVFRSAIQSAAPGFEYRLELRAGPTMGPNAFALPSGTVVMTDELDDQIRQDEELLGVLLHELSHVRHRHGLRMVLQDAGVALLASALLGDIGSVTSAASALPKVLVQSGYSRDFEREADRDAGMDLVRRGVGTRPLRNLLERLGRDSRGDGRITQLSTHPDWEERRRDLEALDPAGVDAEPTAPGRELRLPP